MFIGKRQSPWTSIAVMVLVAVSIVAAAILGVDQLCRRDIARRLPPYPGAVLKSSEHDFLRPRAAGQTAAVFSTSDDVETVRAWNRAVTLSLLEKEQTRGVATVRRYFEAGPNNQGTLIYDSTRCGL